ncbi:hypothetical protein [uncultured Rothia sp.]|uniref:hypothetical protein n=1 Tax=uncultured Rothia sp. TaxID=316088 RepID=UPI0028ED2FC1|nr:hypothetical protein [uncultured Rothia sp.]
MKIQEVIDEVNEAWGEEHEEKSRKIFWDNIIRKPAIIFIAVSILYLFVPGIWFLELLYFGSSNPNWQVWIIGIYFNFPYYILDLRAGIIASIASILLSLYVSVGKYAETADGVVGEARRAAYRQFARRVGKIIFFVFIFNFWHGLLAGWLQRNHVGEPYSIVPVNIDLSRYGDMPLWSLLFFGWFTVASSNMLTYSEKDNLMSKVHLLKKVNKFNLSADYGTRIAYDVAIKELESSEQIPILSSKQQEKSGGYSSLFIRDYGYSGFRFTREPRWKEVMYGIAFLGVSAILFIADGYLGYLAFAGVMVLLELAGFFLSENYLYLSVWRLNVKYVSWMQKISEFFSFFIMGLILEAVRLILMTAMVFAVYMWNIQYFIQIIGLVLIFYIGRWRAKQSIRGEFYQSLQEETDEKLIKDSKDLLLSLKGTPSDSEEKKSSGNEGKYVDYLVISYIYCLIIEVNKYYMDYKAELGNTDLSSNQPESP